MNRLEENQLNFINMRLGTFIHFNSAAVQFSSGEIIDWEFDHENHGAPRQFPFSEKDWNPAGLDCRQWALAAKAPDAGLLPSQPNTMRVLPSGLQPMGPIR